MKKALLLNVINPVIGGVIIRGEKGTAKSTAVRSLAELLPEIPVVTTCPFSCDPHDHETLCSECRSELQSGGKQELEYVYRKVRVVNLPLGATEDRVVGSLNIERAIKEGIKALEPGLLAAANRGILYVDEVNLLEDHIADLLLDSAALGLNIIEREGIHVAHPASFSLIGTMNPEEGEIRPQLLDRFGLQVTVGGLDDTRLRMEIVDLIDEFDRDPTAVWQKHERSQQNLRERLLEATRVLSEVGIDQSLVKLLVLTCQEFNIHTHRAEITTLRASKTIAALAGRTTVCLDDIREAMYYALPHRMRRMPFEPPVLRREELDGTLEHVQKMGSGGSDTVPRPERDDDGRDDGDVGGPRQRQDATGEGGLRGEGVESAVEAPRYRGKSPAEGADLSDAREATGPEDVASDGKIFGIGRCIDPRKLRWLEEDRTVRTRVSGRRLRTLASNRGAYLKSKIPVGMPRDVAFDATVRAAAPHVRARSQMKSTGIRIENEDIRQKVRSSKVATSVVFLVDASGSMEAHERMESAKGAIFSILVDSYQRRDRVGMVSFREAGAEAILPMCSSLDCAVKCLRDLPTGGRTPVSAGLQKALEMLIIEKRRNREVCPLLILISDGRANVALGPFASVSDELIDLTSQAWKYKIHMTFIDVEQKGTGTSRFGAYKKILMDRMSYYHVDHLDSGVITDIVAQEKRLLRGSFE